MRLSTLTAQSSRFTATVTAVVMAGAITVVEATTMDGVEAIIVVITIGETSPPLMSIIPELAAFGRLFLWSQELAACSVPYRLSALRVDFVMSTHWSPSARRIFNNFRLLHIDFRRSIL
jgi:hypothetical protein